MQESFECVARDMLDSLVPPMAERIVAQRLRESVKEQGGLIHKNMLSLRADIAQLRQGKSHLPFIVLFSVTCSITFGEALWMCVYCWRHLGVGCKRISTQCTAMNICRHSSWGSKKDSTTCVSMS